MVDLADRLAERHADEKIVKRMLARHRGNGQKPIGSGVVIFHAEEIPLTGTPLLRHVAAAITRFSAQWGKNVRAVMCDVTQGGDLWAEAAGHIGLPLVGYTLQEGKDWRFGRTLDHYQAVRVLHAVELPTLERQQLAYPKIAHDDVLDSTAAAVLAFLEPKPTRNSSTVFPR
jgi:hypothetical protein